MKKFWITVGALTLFLGSSVLNGQVGLNAQTQDPDYEKIAQEAERNRELLEIWKDHVKTLTKERDQAYQELERLRSGGPASLAQFGGMETAPLPPSPEALQQIDSLQSEVSRLQLELQRKTSSTGATSGSSRELQMQLSALQSQYQQLKKELTESKNDKERALQEKEKAMSQVEELRASSVAVPQPGDDISKNLQKAYDIQKKRYEDLQRRLRELERDYQSLQERGNETPSQSTVEITALQNEIASLENENLRLRSDLQESIASSGAPTDRNTEIFMRQARELQYENDSLKAQVEKLKVVEKELGNARAYFTPMVKEMQEKNDDMVAEKASLAGEIQRAREETNQVSQKIQMMNDQNQNLGADLQTLRKEQEEWAEQMEAYKSQLQMAAADKEKFHAAEQEFQRSQVEIRSLQKVIAGHEQTVASKDEELKRFGSQIETLEKTNRQIESRETDNLKSVERYQTALQANLTDMKNLKSNFEAYLESLVASFDERQR